MADVGLPARVQAKQQLAVLLTAHGAHRAPAVGSPQVSLVAASRPITGDQTTLPVVGHTTGPGGVRWLRVMLPGRPDGSTGWIAQQGTRKIATGWRILVNLAIRRWPRRHRGPRVHATWRQRGKPVDHVGGLEHQPQGCFGGDLGRFVGAFSPAHPAWRTRAEAKKRLSMPDSRQADVGTRTRDPLLTMQGFQGRPISRQSAIFDSYADDSLPSPDGQKRTTLDKKCIELLVSLRYKKEPTSGVEPETSALPWQRSTS